MAVLLKRTEVEIPLWVQLPPVQPIGTVVHNGTWSPTANRMLRNELEVQILSVPLKCPHSSMVERGADNAEVDGSSPSEGTI